MSVTDQGLSAADRLRREIVARRMAGATASAPTAGIPRTDRSGTLPVSFAQERLWFLERLAEHGDAYVLAFARRVRGPLDRDAWQGALDDVVARHEVLRTALVEVDGRPVQRVAAPVAVPLSWQEIPAGADEDARTADARSLAREFAALSFDLAQPPLVRAGVWVLGPDDAVAVVAFHHVACDGWSGRVFIKELTELYLGRVAGTPAALPELPVQYGDFAVWQRERVAGPVLERQLGHWRAALAGVQTLELPCDHARPAARSGRGGAVEVVLPASLVGDVEELGRASGATLFMVLLAAYQAVLARWSGQDDIAVGTPVAGRGHVELEPLIGSFINTLVLRGDLSGAPTFAEFLAGTRETVLAAFDHQDVPFERLVEELRPERDLSRNPLFQAWLVLQNYAPADEAVGPGFLEYLELAEEETFAPFDLSLMAYPADGGLVLRFTYAAELFDEPMVARLAGHVRRMLDAAVADPAVRVREVDLLAPGERDLLVGELSGADRACPAAAEVLPLVTGPAGAPGDVAVVCGEERLTYAELETAVTRLAGALTGRGVRRGSPVGVCVTRGLHSITAMLAVWRAGGVHVPLDPQFPAERLTFMVAEAGVSHVVADPGTEKTARGLGIEVVAADGTADGADGADGTGEAGADPAGGPALPQTAPAGADLAYVIFTSGSTGRPKAVGVEHRALARHVAAAGERFGVTGQDRVLAFSSFTFDAALDQLLPALAAGATVVVRPDEPWLPSQVPSLIERYGVTVANFPPTFWAELVSSLSGPTASRLAGLRLLVLGGEVVPTGALAAWRLLAPHVTVLNAYGPTEAAVTATTYDVSGGTDRGRVPIGRPLGGRRVYVVDEALDVVPLGIPGELLIGGPELARGYLGRPALTAERFVPDPFASDGGRLYRTGDCVRRLPDGTLDFLGRIDDQVKIRGFRVELGEIESALAGCPGVAAAAAAARTDRRGGASLVGYVVPEPGEQVDAAGVRAWCARSLPPYMVPSDVVSLDALPVTAGGKLDRAALPAVVAGRAAAGTEYVAPRDATESMIAEIWREVLGADRVGIDDGFFDLGGHSLLATMAVSRIAERLGRAVELRTLFENPRIRQFAPLVGAAHTVSTAGVVPVDRSGPLPMSYAQERLWFLDRMSDLGDDYVLWFSWRLRGALDRDAWQGALDDVVARHEVLRTALVEVDGRPAQRVLDGVTVPLAWHEVPARGAEDERVDERVEEVRARAQEFATRRFDLARPPMVRSGVWVLGPDDAVAVVVFHHVATDGWSKGIFLRELTAFYRARSAGTALSLPELPVQYGDFAVWQRGWVAGPVLEGQLDYWRDALSGVPALELPTDRPRPPVRSGRGGSVEVALPDGLAGAVEELGRASGATLFMVLLAAYQVVLARWSGQDDIAVGTPVAGRGRVELEPLIGFFVNTLVMRGDLSGGPSFLAHLDRVREGVLGAFDHQDVPFERLVEELRPERDLSRNPLFQVMFDVQDRSAAPPPAAGLGHESFPLTWDSAKFDLTSTFIVHDGRLALETEYSSDLFDEATVRRLAEHVGRVLEAVVADPSVAVTEVALLSPAEREGVLALSGADSPAPAPAPFAWSARAGDVAVVCGEERLTYAELETAVARLAGTLTGRGVRRGSPVGVCVTRGLHSITAMLAIWRAGGVHVPLDPQFPAERLAFMVAEADVSHVVADARTEDTARGLGVEVVAADGTAGPAGPDHDGDRDPDRRVALLGGAAPAAGDLAYVIFTSGSTGRPKAVGVGHEALARHVAAARELFGLTARDRVLAFASLSFDASLEQILPGLSAGAAVVLRPDELWSVAELAERIRAEGVTVTELTPAYWEEVVARLDEVAADLGSLRLLVTGGEALPSAPLRAWFELLPGVEIVNTYGPTESVISATAHRITGPLSGRVPIGRPLGGRRVYVVDEALDVVPLGTPGELLIGGPESARGYLGRPALTAERFVPDPFTPGGGRLYRTGDRVRQLPDGTLDFLGRVDDQVKIRGFRIEPGEIEAVLGECPQVRGAAVLVREVRGERMLVGYVAGSGTGAEALGEWCRRFLPGYMVPGAFVVLDALPLTVQGKVDTAALPVPEPPAAAQFAPPSSPTEIVTAQVWAEVLGVDRIGLRDNFFDLGGHSMRAVAAASRLRTTFDCPVQVRDLFEHPTVERLAAEVERLLIEQIAAMSEEEIDLSLTADPRNR